MKTRKDKIKQNEEIERIAWEIDNLKVTGDTKKVTLYSDRFKVNHHPTRIPPKHAKFLGNRRVKTDNVGMMKAKDMESRIMMFKKKVFDYYYKDRDCILTTLTSRDDIDIYQLQKHVWRLCERLRHNFRGIEYICKYEPNKDLKRFHMHIMLIFNGKKPRSYTKKWLLKTWKKCGSIVHVAKYKNNPQRMMQYILKIQKHYYDAKDPEYTVYPANFMFITHSKFIDVEEGITLNTDNNGIKELYKRYSNQENCSNKLRASSINHKFVDFDSGEVKLCSTTTYVTHS